MEGDRFISFQISHLETDLWIGVNKECYFQGIEKDVYNKIKSLRDLIENYISLKPIFKDSFSPIPDDLNAPEEIRAMIKASTIAGTGPMSAVAGLFSQVIGELLLNKYGAQEVVVENGGDIFLKVLHDIDMAIYAGKSEFSNKIAVTIPYNSTPIGICTSSGTVGHSKSFGNSDAVMVACKDTALADALATRLGNEVKSINYISSTIQLSEKFSKIVFLIIIVDNKIGIKGKFSIKPIG